ncbi:MAG: hypothetical protein ACJAZ2_001590 [Glaciecola sp.]|jgi:hypothetical protein
MDTRISSNLTYVLKVKLYLSVFPLLICLFIFDGIWNKLFLFTLIVVSIYVAYRIKFVTVGEKVLSYGFFNKKTIKPKDIVSVGWFFSLYSLKLDNGKNILFMSRIKWFFWSTERLEKKVLEIVRGNDEHELPNESI